MKTKKLNKKLSLKKMTVSNLNGDAMTGIKGGISGTNTEPPYCDTEITCGVTICDYPGCNNTNTCEAGCGESRTDCITGPTYGNQVTCVQQLCN